MSRNYYLIEVLSSGDCDSQGPYPDENTRDNEAKRLAQDVGEAAVITSMDHTILWASVEDGELLVGRYTNEEIGEWFYDGTYVDRLIKGLERILKAF